MLETITLIALTLLLMSILRPGKTPPLDNPLVIERPGQYHMTLAPQINLAQPFIEAVAAQIGFSEVSARNSATLYFEVNDNQVTAHGHDCYLLAVTQRNGMLYFQAAGPKAGKSDTYFNTIREFAESAMARIPASGEPDETLNRRIVEAIRETARVRNIRINHLLG